MLLSESTQELCQTPLFKFDIPTQAWQEVAARCTLAVYDRFVSDRAFGQKKRVLHTSGYTSPLPDTYYRVGTPERGPVFMLESENDDADERGIYLKTYMVRQLKYRVQALSWKVVGTLPTGQQQRILIPEETWDWGDLDAVSTSRSEDLPIQFTQMQLIMPGFFQCEPDAILRLSLGSVTADYRIQERYQVLQANVFKVARHG